ncbi:MAG TPA: cysteine synthase A [Candidatus Lokiarchaeia archaeon]|nr:cysteine synthase A [Candidatus Lokiarchaeia archaeon]
MGKYYNNILETIGNTPVVKLNRMGSDLASTVLVKLESRNPGASVKDRIALAMIEAAEKEGMLTPESHIVEPTSGNTGIGLAMVAAVKGYKLTLTMPESMTIERRKILRAFGANLVLTPKEKGMKGAIARAEEIATEENGVFIPQQFKNLANPEVHRRTTAREILDATEGHLDAFVSGVGTGGTITGVGEVLKQEIGDSVRIVAVEPADSPVLSGGQPSPHKIQGIGAGFIPEILNTSIYDQIVQVQYADAKSTARDLAALEGIFVGISSGAAAWAALQVARDFSDGQVVLALLPDTGERYLSTELWEFPEETPTI